MLKLIAKDFDKTKILRLGIADKVNEKLNEFTLEKLYDSKNRIDKKKALKLINKSQVIFTTCSSTMLSYLDEVNVKYLLVDEATQAFEPSLMMPLSHGCEKMCLIGDHKQLPPLVKNKNVKEELSNTLFERMLKLGFIKRVMLNTQYRMNPAIAEFSSKEFYESKLLNARLTETNRKGMQFSWEKTLKSILFIDMPQSLEKMLDDPSKVLTKSI
jgi:regulator of nonsense transcripts 1